jgi:hypothetical protein
MKEKAPPHNKDRGKLQVYELAALKQAIKKNGYQLMIGGIAYTVATNDSWKAEIASLAAALSPSPKSLTDQIYNAKQRIKKKNQGGYTADVAWLNEETMLKMSMDSANNYQNEEF